MTGRQRSHWAWGYEDALPDHSARTSLGNMVSALLGASVAEPGSAPSIDAIELEPPAIEVPAHLAGLLSAAKDDRIRHTYGKAYPDLIRGYAGSFEPAPDLVAYPHDEDGIWAVLDFCAGRNLAVIPFGGGTSVVGGVEGEVGSRFNGVVSVDLTGFDRVVEIDDVSRAARMQAGLRGPALEQALGQHGFTLRHYPQSFEFSTLGGWIATRAGGHFATLYTHIDDLVESIRMITPAGVWQSRRLPASGAGPSPDRLALGSEGILGLITEAWMRIRKRPKWRASGSVRFADHAAAVGAVRELSQSGLYPSNCRLLDGREAMLHQVGFDNRSVLLIGFESDDHPVEPWMARALAIAHSRGGEGTARFSVEGEKPAGARDSDAAGAWKAAFVRAPYLQSALVTLGLVVDTFETACTWNMFEALDRAVRERTQAAMDEVCGGGVIACRFTHVYPDGPAPYYTFIAPGGGGELIDKWRAIKAAASSAIVDAGGTITHHHAVGRTHRPWYETQRPEPFALALTGAKRAVDPRGMLNPGVLVPAIEAE